MTSTDTESQITDFGPIPKALFDSQAGRQCKRTLASLNDGEKF